MHFFSWFLPTSKSPFFPFPDRNFEYQKMCNSKSKQNVLLGAAAEVDKSKTFSFLGLLGVPFPEDNETPEPLEDDDEDGVAFVTFKELVGMRLVAEAEEAVAEFNAPGDD